MKNWCKIHEYKDYDVLIKRGSSDEDGEHIEISLMTPDSNIDFKLKFKDNEKNADEAFKNANRYNVRDLIIEHLGGLMKIELTETQRAESASEFLKLKKPDLISDGYWTKQAELTYSDVAMLMEDYNSKTIEDYEDVMEDQKRLVRQIDEIINGKEGMAKQASLCDIVGQIEELVKNQK